MIDVDPRLSYPKVVLLATVSMSIGVVFLLDCVHAWSAIGAPVVEGNVIARGETRLWGGIPSGRMTIRIVGRPTTVEALMSRKVMARLPNRVRFHYTGDPAREVYVEGEDNPILGVLLFWGLGAAVIAVYVRTRGRPGYEGIVS